MSRPLGLIAGSGYIAKARSALGKVLKRLNAAIANLMRLASKSPDPLMDYQSLMSLSCSSRVQTIKAFDQLSRRLGSSNGGSSRGSVVSAATSSGSKTTSKSSRSSKTTASSSSASRSDNRRRHGKKSSALPKKPQSGTGDRRTTRTAAAGTHESSSRREREAGPPRLETLIPTPMLDMVVTGGSERRDASPLGRRASLMRRLSIMSISSASTKLGEIPERRWHRRGPDDDWAGLGGGGGMGSLDEYSAPTVYPLRPYQPVVKERKFMGLFRRGM